MKNILVVDDEDTIRITMSEWFAVAHADAQYNVLLAADGKEAVKLLAAEKVDLLITDLNMPKMDGFELLAHMNNNYSSTPIIVMSAFATPDIKKKVIDLGAAQFIPKPFSFEDLEEIDFNRIFAPPKKKNNGKGYVNGISLQSFLQLISIEAKTCTLQIKSGDKTGTMYILNGELINALSGNLDGGNAARDIISWNDAGLTIEIDHECTNKDRKIQFTIMGLLMEAARLQDEREAAESGRVDEEGEAAVKEKGEPEPSSPPKSEVKPAPVTVPEVVPEPPPMPKPVATQPPSPPVAVKSNKNDLAGINLPKVQERLKEFSAIDGFAGAALLTVNGEPLQMVSTSGSNVNLESAGVFANNILTTARSSTRNMGIGISKMVQIDTESGHLFISGRDKFNVMLILASSSSLGLAKMMVTKVLEEIADDMKN
ncbi:MAG: response regulator [Proteobacteria bacterium]|nr:response regulator [Pseudomonadota bacterium]MBU1739335.1 response regulator [Pseudomonadota bacterium]